MSLISNLKVKFSADNKPLEKGVKKAKKTVGGFGKSLKKIAGLMAGAFAFKKIADFVSSSVKAYDIQIQAEKKLERQLISNGKTSRATLTDYKKFASELQNITTVGDETTLGLLQLAESMDSIDAKKATKGTIGLAKAFGIDLRSALKMVVLAEKGDFTMLQRYVPALRSATTAVEKAAIVQKTLADGFKLATVEAKTGLGPVKQLSNSYGDLKETIGSKFFGDSSPFIKFLSNTVKWFDGIIKSSPVDDLELTRLKVNTLTTELALSNTPLKRRKTILDELKKIAPETVKGINAEKINYKKLTTQVEAYNKVMIQKIALSNITKEDKKF